jgi:hypothetical protein
MYRSCDNCAYQGRPRCTNEYTKKGKPKKDGMCRLYWRKTKVETK